MGQEQSSPINEGTPQTLRDRSIESIAEYIKNGRAEKIVVMVSALEQSTKEVKHGLCLILLSR